MLDEKQVLQVTGEVDVDAIYRNPKTRLVKKKRRGPAPMFGKAMKGYYIKLDEESVAKARRLGNGNFSKGVRIALARRTKELIAAFHGDRSE